MTASDPEALVFRQLVVARDLATVFRLWTEQIDTWWPAGHSRSGDPATQVFLEGRAGGRFYERSSSGQEYEWGQVVIWEPPHRLAYTWYLGSDATRPSRVEVRFTALGPERTRVEVRHRGPEYVGELWWDRRDRFAAAWDAVLRALVAG